MPLEPSIRKRLDEDAARGLPPVEQLTPEELRNGLSWLVQQQPRHQIKGLEVTNRKLEAPHGTLPVRIYQKVGTKNVPVLLYFHGGGWVNGTLDSHDEICRLLAAESNATVVSVAYRRAPEHRFPAAPQDCLAATDWVFTRVSELRGDGRVLVAGDSAGGNLAAVVALMRRDQHKQPTLAGQILLWPATAYYHPPTQSYLDYGEGFGLRRKGMSHFWDLYLNDPEEAKNPYAAPLAAAELGNLPPALVITAEYDVLRDEGEEYARRLSAAGVPVKQVRVSGVNHGFAAWPDADFDLPQARETRRIIAEWVTAIRR
jgi:acetyl esterase